MELCDSQVRQLLALEQVLSKASGLIRTILVSPNSCGQARVIAASLLAKNNNAKDSLHVVNRFRSTSRVIKGYVYCIQDLQSGFYKVGQTVKAPLYRLSSLQTSTPNELAFCFAIRVNDLHSTETAIHLHLADDHIRGEWFSSDLNKIHEAFRSEDFEFWSGLTGRPVTEEESDNLGKESLRFDEREEPATGPKCAQI
jgi:hypothetical protein